MSDVERENQCGPSRLARIHGALADPVRLRMLALILMKPLSPEELARVLALDSHIIARHLTYLRDAGVVSRQRRGGQTPYYSVRKVAECAEAQLVHLTLDLLRLEPDMHVDITMLTALCEREAELRATEVNQASLAAQNGSPPGADHLPVADAVPSTSWLQPSHSA